MLLKYKFDNVVGKNSALAIGIGSKIPLGSSTEKNSAGITLNADLQSGSNAWDLIYWISASQNFNFKPTLTISSRLIYRDTGTNDSYFGDSTYKFGEELQWFLGFSDQFLFFKTLINPSISFKYRSARQDKINGFNLDNTGGDWLFIIPNFSISISPTISFSTRVELPMYSKVDGTQLTPSYKITSGILIKIQKKENVFNLN